MKRSLLLISLCLVTLPVLSFLTGCSLLDNSPAPEKGWSRATWDAGYGSWAFGGVGVNYTIDLPPGYTFDSKLGMGYIGTGDADDVITMEFWTKAMGQPIKVREHDGTSHDEVVLAELDFEKFKKIHEELAKKHPEAQVTVSPEKDVEINGMKFRRIDYTQDNGQLHGVRLQNDNIIVAVNAQPPDRFQLCDKIVGSLRKK